MYFKKLMIILVFFIYSENNSMKNDHEKESDIIIDMSDFSANPELLSPRSRFIANKMNNLLKEIQEERKEAKRRHVTAMVCGIFPIAIGSTVLILTIANKFPTS